MVLFISTVLVFLLVSYRHPDFMFWLALTIWVDPGGYVSANLSRSAIGGLQETDLTFLLLMIPLLSPKINIKQFFIFRDNRWIVSYLLFFSIFYHVLIFGFIVPGGSFTSMLEVLQYQRLTLWGFVAIIPAYIFFKRSYPLLIKFAVITSVVISAFYLIYLLTGIQLLDIWSANRGFIDATRISMRSYGFAYWFINITFVAILFKFKLPKRNWIYFVGITLFIAVMLTLTRRSILQVFWGFVLIYFLRQKLYNQMILSTSAVRFIFIIVAFFIAFSFVIPGQIKVIGSVVENAFSSVTNEESLDHRLEVNIPLHLARFRASPVFGDGWDRAWLSNQLDEGGLAAHETTLTAALGMFGLAGLILFSIFYFRMFKILYQSYKTLKIYFQNRFLHSQYLSVFIISFILVVSFLIKYTINFMGYFGELIQPHFRISTMLYVGFLLASRDMLNAYINKHKIENNLR